MALLTLKDIGKIYVSDTNVVVGIRGVNLSFERGEFVAVTGKSGSGKSTLLNVISGMDTYEEGELYIEGAPTSHYLQPDWEVYREKYISFIFQDYNIIDSFTVLQNVELALMHIEDKAKRRNKALELLERVGMSSHIHHKGSKLSGGQKQRTVIARALAKDSPIILADEPTGNLDSVTSKEIIALLSEVSKDKLVIVVTHNFEQLSDCATRHIRIFDGAVESDHVLCNHTASDEPKTEAPKEPKKRGSDLAKGFTLGRAIFTAKPKLTFFICLLMVIATLGIFTVTATYGSEAMYAFKKNYMFNPIEGRLVITKQSGQVITDAELAALVEKYHAVDSLHYDLLLDYSYEDGAIVFYDAKKDSYDVEFCHYTYGEDFGSDIVGSYPKNPDEVFLYLPISYQPYFGKNTIQNSTVMVENIPWKVSGVKYYYDNNQPGRCLFTDEGFRLVTATHYLQGNGDLRISVSPKNGEENGTWFEYYSITPSYDVEEGKLYIGADDFRRYTSSSAGATVSVNAVYYNYNFYDYNSQKQYVFSRTFDDSQLTDVEPNLGKDTFGYNKEIIIHPSLMLEMTDQYLAKSYAQASLFFENNKQAHAAVDALREEGYVAVPADTTYEPDVFTAIMSIISCIMMGAMWLLAIVFFAFFVNLCTGKALDAFKGDMAIMRSMGISVKIIRISMYVRMLLSLIPAFVLLVITAVLIYTTPQFNYFAFLYGWQYALIVLGMLLMTVRVTHKQIRRLFGESVKKALKGGNTQ